MTQWAPLVISAAAILVALTALWRLRGLKQECDYLERRGDEAKRDYEKEYVYSWAALGLLDAAGRRAALQKAEDELKRRGLWYQKEAQRVERWRR